MTRYERKFYAVLFAAMLSWVAAWVWSGLWSSETATGLTVGMMALLQLVAVGLTLLVVFVSIVALPRLQFRMAYGDDNYQKVYGDIINYQAPAGAARRERS